jgi:hypothetical protein
MKRFSAKLATVVFSSSVLVPALIQAQTAPGPSGDTVNASEKVAYGDDAHRYSGEARRQNVDWMEKVSDEQYGK